jgi:hypothetical protein
MFGPLILAKQAVGKLLEQAKTLGLRPPNIRTLRKASYISKGREGELFAGGVSLLLASIRNQLAFLAKADRACSGKVSSPAARS